MPVFMCNVTVSYIDPATQEIASANRALIQTGRSEKLVKEQALEPLAFEMQSELGLQDGKDTFGFAFSCKKLEAAHLQEMLRVAQLSEDPLDMRNGSEEKPEVLN